MVMNYALLNTKIHNKTDVTILLSRHNSRPGATSARVSRRPSGAVKQCSHSSQYLQRFLRTRHSALGVAREVAVTWKGNTTTSTPSQPHTRHLWCGRAAFIRPFPSCSVNTLRY